MRDLNLRALMNSLERTQDYYARIPPDGDITYEETYHLLTKDPDGKERDLLTEKEHSLAASKEVMDFLASIPPGKILDVGCGLGWILSALDGAWDKHGIEISKFAAQHATQFGRIHNGTLDDFQGASFDVVLMNHVIEHLTDPVKVIQKVHALLKVGGRLIIGTPDFDSGAARRYGSRFRLLHDPTHISLFSSDSMHRFLRDHGFRIVEVEYPYFDTMWFTEQNLIRMLDDTTISPPFYGSTMTFLCERL